MTNNSPNSEAGYQLSDAERSMIEFVEESVYDWKDEDQARDMIFGEADSLCPIYTCDVLSFAQQNLWLGVEMPDFEADSPVAAIQANIVYHLEEIGQQHAMELRPELFG